MSNLLLLTAFFTLLLAASTVRAHAPFGRPGYINTHLNAFRLHVNDQRRAKCYPAFRFKFTPAELQAASDLIRKRARVTYKRRHYGVHAAGSRCQPAIPAFPWMALARCESGADWDYNGGSGFDGGFQFLPSTWSSARQGITGAAYAYQASAYVQYLVARSWLAKTSWAQWPTCSAALGLR